MVFRLILISTFTVFIIPIAMSYEFETSNAGVENWDTYGLGEPSYNSVSNNSYEVTINVKPEECRLYLTYEAEGQGQTSLLQQAKEVKAYLDRVFENFQKEKIIVEPSNYSPEKALVGIFQKEKDELRVIFRITIQLETEGENNFWNNAEIVAQVMDKISEVKKDGKWGRRLFHGRISYAVDNIEPTRKFLLNKINDQVKDMRKSFAMTNGVDKAEVSCDIEYGNLSITSTTLEEVKVSLPYSVDFKLKNQ